MMPSACELVLLVLGLLGFGTKTIPAGALLPTEHSKNYDGAWDSSVFWGSMVGKQSIRKTCHCRATRCYKKPELLAGTPPSSLNKRNKFQYTVHWGGGGSEAKSLTFCNGKHMVKKDQIQ